SAPRRGAAHCSCRIAPRPARGREYSRAVRLARAGGQNPLKKSEEESRAQQSDREHETNGGKIERSGKKTAPSRAKPCPARFSAELIAIGRNSRDAFRARYRFNEIFT